MGKLSPDRKWRQWQPHGVNFPLTYNLSTGISLTQNWWVRLIRRACPTFTVNFCEMFSCHLFSRHFSLSHMFTVCRVARAPNLDEGQLTYLAVSVHAICKVQTIVCTTRESWHCFRSSVQAHGKLFLLIFPLLFFSSFFQIVLWCECSLWPNNLSPLFPCCLVFIVRPSQQQKLCLIF